jgi:hypothetical protein
MRGRVCWLCSVHFAPRVPCAVWCSERAGPRSRALLPCLTYLTRSVERGGSSERGVGRAGYTCSLRGARAGLPEFRNCCQRERRRGLIWCRSDRGGMRIVVLVMRIFSSNVFKTEVSERITISIQKREAENNFRRGPAEQESATLADTHRRANVTTQETNKPARNHCTRHSRYSASGTSNDSGSTSNDSHRPPPSRPNGSRRLARPSTRQPGGARTRRSAHAHAHARVAAPRHRIASHRIVSRTATRPLSNALTHRDAPRSDAMRGECMGDLMARTLGGSWARAFSPPQGLCSPRQATADRHKT